MGHISNSSFVSIFISNFTIVSIKVTHKYNLAKLNTHSYNIIGFLGELLCFWLRSSFILHVKLMVGGAAPELLHKSGAKGVSLEGKFG